MSKRKYTIRRGEGLHLTDRQREILGNAWNQYVNRLVPVSMREFARLHGVPYSTWQREFRRGAASPIMRRGNRWTYPEYDIDKARASINEGRGNMGAKMKLTVSMSILFRHAVLRLRRSPYDARMMIVEAFPDRDVPCLKTFYNHIESGDMASSTARRHTTPARERSRGTPPTRRGRSPAGARSGTGRRPRTRRRSSGTTRWTPSSPRAGPEAGCL